MKQAQNKVKRITTAAQKEKGKATKQANIEEDAYHFASMRNIREYLRDIMDQVTLSDKVLGLLRVFYDMIAHYVASHASKYRSATSGKNGSDVVNSASVRLALKTLCCGNRYHQLPKELSKSDLMDSNGSRKEDYPTLARLKIMVKEVTGLSKSSKLSYESVYRIHQVALYFVEEIVDKSKVAKNRKKSSKVTKKGNLPKIRPFSVTVPSLIHHAAQLLNKFFSTFEYKVRRSNEFLTNLNALRAGDVIILSMGDPAYLTAELDVYGGKKNKKAADPLNAARRSRVSKILFQKRRNVLTQIVQNAGKSQSFVEAVGKIGAGTLASAIKQGEVLVAGGIYRLTEDEIAELRAVVAGVPKIEDMSQNEKKKLLDEYKASQAVKSKRPLKLTESTVRVDPGHVSFSSANMTKNLDGFVEAAKEIGRGEPKKRKRKSTKKKAADAEAEKEEEEAPKKNTSTKKKAAAAAPAQKKKATGGSSPSPQDLEDGVSAPSLDEEEEEEKSPAPAKPTKKKAAAKKKGKGKSKSAKDGDADKPTWKRYAALKIKDRGLNYNFTLAKKVEDEIRGEKDEMTQKQLKEYDQLAKKYNKYQYAK